MFAALVALIHKTDLPRDQVLEVLAACCLPQLLGHPQQMNSTIRIKSSQDAAYLAYKHIGKAGTTPGSKLGKNIMALN